MINMGGRETYWPATLMLKFLGIELGFCNFQLMAS